jgi:hypothetical protein
MNRELRLYEDRIGAKAQGGTLPGCVRAFYVVEGSVALQVAQSQATLHANSGFGSMEAVQWKGASLACVVLRWELVDATQELTLLSGEGLSSRLSMRASIALDDRRDYLLRCDRVEFPAGGEALLHRHQGGGIRCLLMGSIQIQTEGTTHDYGVLEPWFEAGPDPVYAGASKTEPTAFARVMILPRELLGKSSIQYVRPEDLDKPKNQKYQVFVDLPIQL